MPLPLSRTQGRFIGTFLLGAALSMPAAYAAPVTVTFLPPDIPSQDVCVAKKADPDVVARWNAWDGTSVPEGDPDVVLRDARRLRDLNPTGNFELVDKMLAIVAKMPAPKVPDTSIDRINLYLKAGKIPQLRQTGILDQMEASEASLAPKALNLLATLYLDGIVVKKDKAKGLGFLTRSAMGGNADALLRLASINLAGETIEGWDLDPKLSVTMAFGALVGKLDPEICDRIGRIAREYSKGEVVQQDHAIAEKWMRLAADLGDASAAWKVAQLHLESELIVKNNDILLKYLKLASDRGVAAAEVELGKLYEAGALLPLDMGKAEELYAEASKTGSRNALFRLATMLEEQPAEAKTASRYKETLTQLTSLPQPPGWAFSKLADVVLAERGRWAGEKEAQALLERGVQLEDADSAQELASILLRHRDEPGIFERATELLGFAVTYAGKIDPMTDLRQAYLCRAPKGADMRLASFWQRTEDAAGNSTVFMTPEDVDGLDIESKPLELARLQTHALYGRPNSVAYYLDYLKKNGASQDIIDFWQSRVDPVPATIDAVARFSVMASPTPEAIEATLEALKKANAAGLPRAPVDLATALLDYFPNDADKRNEAIAYLEQAAANGNGAAILRLLPMMQEQGIGPEKLFEQYAQAIEDRGDADALIFAAGVTGDAAKKRDYLYRAASVVDCTFQNTVKLAGAFVATADDAETEHWLQVSLRLAGDDGWRQVAIGDRYMAMGGPERAKTAIALYEKGVELGDDTAVSRLVKIYSDPDSQDYAPTKAVAMFKRMIDDAPVAKLAELREKVQKAPTAIRTALSEEIDWTARYAASAATGDVIAMRELALYLRETGTTADDAKTASQWLIRAADGGDATAMVELAKAYAMGIGLAPSIKQAQLLLKDAAGLGNEEARHLLVTMAAAPVEN
ncbi:tetratricopeptide repeat protein [Devosia sp.]|uniref:tetratricopeptide repeat protein n=1 Tax=Devosia sp. TaxID=1871048 RepID=UPI003BA97B92